MVVTSAAQVSPGLSQAPKHGVGATPASEAACREVNHGKHRDQPGSEGSHSQSPDLMAPHGRSGGGRAAASSCSGVTPNPPWSGEGNHSHPGRFPPAFHPGCDSPSSAGSPGARLIAGVGTAGLELAQGGSPQTQAGRLWGPQRQLFRSLCSRTCSHPRRPLPPHTGACTITPAPAQAHTDCVRLCSASISCSTPARASPWHLAQG